MALVHQDRREIEEDSDRLYRLIAETIPHLVWTARADGGLDFFNARCHEYTGLDAGALQGWGWKSVVHWQDWERCLATWTRALQTGERYEIEYRLRRADGVYRWHHGTAVPVRGADGRIVRWFGTCTDIEGEIRSAQILERMVEDRTRALREAEQRFRSFMEHAPVMAWVRDSGGRYTYVNPRYSDDVCRPAEEIVGGRVADFFPAEVAARFDETDRLVQRERRPHEAVESVPTRDGRVARWLKVKFPLPEGNASTAIGGIALDITERSRLEEALRESERRFEAFMDNSPAIAWSKDGQGRYTYVSGSYQDFYGKSAADILGKTDRDLADDETVRRRSEEDAEVLAQGRALQWVRKLNSPQVPEGDERVWLIVKFPLADRSGATGIGAMAIDITERSRLQSALQESEARFRSFMEHSPAVAWIKDHDLRYVFVSQPYQKELGKDAAAMLGRDDYQVWPEAVAREFRKNDKEVLSRGVEIQTIEAAPGADAKQRSWLVVKFPMPDATGRMGIAGMGIDVTERMEAENLARRYAMEVRGLLNRLVVTQESERRRLADELHDLIGQNLTALGIELASLEAAVGGRSERLAPRLDGMRALLAATVDAIRGVMTDLRPPALEEYGLASGLRAYAHAFAARSGLKVAVSVSGMEQRLPQDLELVLFRIVQEALTNTMKHSGAAAVQVALSRDGPTIRLLVEDDGRGFTNPVGARSEQRGGWGLPAMRERAEAHGGTLRVEFPERGARLVVELPAPRSELA
jgi:PAS domain S-box-containing protein